AYYRRAYDVNNRCIINGVRHALHYVQLKLTKLALANSKYVANLLKEVSVNAKVLHPPVRSREIMQYTLGAKWTDKKELIVTTARISPGKQLEFLPLIASKVKSVKFVLAGSLADKNYYARLLRLKRVFHADNLSILTNLSKSELYKLLSKARIYLHTAHHEQFGIAIVEGMAAGCVPIVHRSGGPYYDVLDEKEGLYGFSYNDVEEAAHVIEESTHRTNEWREVGERARLRSLKFDESLFSLKVRRVIGSMLGYSSWE
ncbi:MAG: glycosyltransferase, partial [Candidatus Nezhaarchaeota archaeon]|nr:glycosyltransferase [Candidatus Nezhaarchaeota archaeon]